MYMWPYEVSSLTREEIDEAIQDTYWQSVRLSMKGTSTEEKLEVLQQYLIYQGTDGRCLERKHIVQVDNYINALLRGGQLTRSIHNSIVVQR